MPLPKGAGKQVDIAAAKLIQKLGKERLPEFVKLYFANTEKAFRLLNSIDKNRSLQTPVLFHPTIVLIVLL